MIHFLNILIFLFSLSAFGSDFIDVIFDVEGTLVEPDIYNHPLSALDHYAFLPGADVFLEKLSQDAEIRVHYFTGGRGSKAERILKGVGLPNGRTAFDIKKGLYDVRDLNESLQKDLSRIPGINMERAILVEDSAHYVAKGQSRNVIYVGDLNRKYRIPYVETVLGKARQFSHLEGISLTDGLERAKLQEAAACSLLMRK